MKLELKFVVPLLLFIIAIQIPSHQCGWGFPGGGKPSRNSEPSDDDIDEVADKPNKPKSGSAPFWKPKPNDDDDEPGNKRNKPKSRKPTDDGDEPDDKPNKPKLRKPTDDDEPDDKPNKPKSRKPTDDDDEPDHKPKKPQSRKPSDDDEEPEDKPNKPFNFGPIWKPPKPNDDDDEPGNKSKPNFGFPFFEMTTNFTSFMPPPDWVQGAAVGKFAFDALNLFLKKGFFFGGDSERNKPPFDMKPPDQMFKGINLSINDDGEPYDHLLTLFENVVYLSPHRAHPWYLKRDSAGMDPYALIGDILALVHFFDCTGEQGPLLEVFYYALQRITIIQLRILIGYLHADGVMTISHHVSNIAAVQIALAVKIPTFGLRGFLKMTPFGGTPKMPSNDGTSDNDGSFNSPTTDGSNNSTTHGGSPNISISVSANVTMEGRFISAAPAFGLIKQLGSPCVLICEGNHDGLKIFGIFGAIPEDYLVKVRMDEEGRMDPEDLEKQIIKAQKAGRTPFIVIATVGTTNLGAVDPIEEIADIAEKYDLWLHIDGAHGGPCLFDEDFKEKWPGMERSNSFSFSFSSMLGVPFSASYLLTRNEGILMSMWDLEKMYSFVTTHANSLLYHSLKFTDSQKSWLMWLVKGNRGIRQHVEYAFKLTRYFRTKIKPLKNFQLLTSEVDTTVVPFRVVPDGIKPNDTDYVKDMDKFTKDLQMRLIIEGFIYITITRARPNTPKHFIISLANSILTESDLDYIIDKISCHAKHIDGKQIGVCVKAHWNRIQKLPALATSVDGYAPYVNTIMPDLHLPFFKHLFELIVDTSFGFNQKKGSQAPVAALDLGLGELGLKTSDFQPYIKEVMVFMKNTFSLGPTTFKMFDKTLIVSIIADFVTSLMSPAMDAFATSPPFMMIKEELEKIIRIKVGYPNGKGDGTVLPPDNTMDPMFAINLARFMRSDDKKSKKGSPEKILVLFISKEAHYSWRRAAATLGLGLENCRYVPADETTGKMDVKALRVAIEQSTKDGEEPFMVVGTLGTDVVGAVDPFDDIFAICAEFGLWFHVDGRKGGPVIFSDNERKKLKGIEKSDSFSFGPSNFYKRGAADPFSILVTRKENVIQNMLDQDKKHGDEDDGTNLNTGRRSDEFKFWIILKSEGMGETAARIENILRVTQNGIKNMQDGGIHRGTFKLILKKFELNSICFQYLPRKYKGEKDPVVINKVQVRMGLILKKNKIATVYYTNTTIFEEGKHGFLKLDIIEPAEQNLFNMIAQVDKYGEEVDLSTDEISKEEEVEENPFSATKPVKTRDGFGDTKGESQTIKRSRTKVTKKNSGGKKKSSTTEKNAETKSTASEDSNTEVAKTKVTKTTTKVTEETYTTSEEKGKSGDGEKNKETQSTSQGNRDGNPGKKGGPVPKKSTTRVTEEETLEGKQTNVTEEDEEATENSPSKGTKGRQDNKKSTTKITEKTYTKSGGKQKSGAGEENEPQNISQDTVDGHRNTQGGPASKTSTTKVTEETYTQSRGKYKGGNGENDEETQSTLQGSPGKKGGPTQKKSTTQVTEEETYSTSKRKQKTAAGENDDHESEKTVSEDNEATEHVPSKGTKGREDTKKSTTKITKETHTKSGGKQKKNDEEDEATQTPSEDTDEGKGSAKKNKVTKITTTTVTEEEMNSTSGNKKKSGTAQKNAAEGNDEESESTVSEDSETNETTVSKKSKTNVPEEPEEEAVEKNETGKKDGEKNMWSFQHGWNFASGGKKTDGTTGEDDDATEGVPSKGTKGRQNTKTTTTKVTEEKKHNTSGGRKKSDTGENDEETESTVSEESETKESKVSKKSKTHVPDEDEDDAGKKRKKGKKDEAKNGWGFNWKFN